MSGACWDAARHWGEQNLAVLQVTQVTAVPVLGDEQLQVAVDAAYHQRSASNENTRRECIAGRV